MLIALINFFIFFNLYEILSIFYSNVLIMAYVNLNCIVLNVCFKNLTWSKICEFIAYLLVHFALIYLKFYTV